MRRLLPSPADDIDVYDAYRPPTDAGPDQHGPWTRINMVTSLDGHIAGADGVSGTIGGDGDSQAFFAMRHLADAVVAGAGTVRAEGYGPMRLRDGWRARRAASGRTGPAAIVVVTGSVDLDMTSPLFTEAVTPTMVLTTTDAPADRVAAVRGAGGVVLQHGEGGVDLTAGLAALREEHGLMSLLVEGGPRLNGQLLEAGLVDELCLTLGHVLVGGDDEKRILTGWEGPRDLTLTDLLEDEGELLARYRV